MSFKMKWTIYREGTSLLPDTVKLFLCMKCACSLNQGATLIPKMCGNATLFMIVCPIYLLVHNQKETNIKQISDCIHRTVQFLKYFPFIHSTHSIRFQHGSINLL